MLTNFSTEYAQRSDDELLELANQRHSLTQEAVTALDAELRRRNLTESDRVEHRKFVKHQEWREHRVHRRKLFGKRQFSWRELLSGFVALGVIAWAYFSLPKPYRLKPDWEEAAVCVVIASVFVIVGWRSLWRNITYWIALILSASIQLAVVHAWVQRTGRLNRSAGKLATLFGFVLFFAIYGCFRLLRRNFYGGGSTASG
ncbi:MAG TPA: hypothetical protein VGS27_32685 [Candidatus Sulfotelmatobacter sp.]|nr:hypothetical protein [Candidatus Sulfotelmatobacter sp.]